MRPAGLAETWTDAGAAPEDGKILTQLELAEAAHERAPPPGFVIDMLCAAGAEAPIV